MSADTRACSRPGHCLLACPFAQDKLRVGRDVITGDAGFIGPHVTDRLLADGHDVVGIDSFEDYTRKNLLATQHQLGAYVVAEVLKVVYASSSSVYGDQHELPLREDMVPRPRWPYGVTKLAGEHLCGFYHANHGLDTVSLRFFTAYGPRQRPDMTFHKFIKAMLEGREIVIYGDGTQTRDFTYVDDIVEGLVLAQNAPPGAVMNLGGGNRVSLAEAIATLGHVMGVEPKVARQPVEAGDVRDALADVSKAEKSVDYRPTTMLAAGLAAEFAWLAGQRSMIP